MQVKHPTAAQEALAAAMDLTQLTLFIAVLWLLRGIVRSVRLDEPFGAGTVRRLRGIAGVLLIGAPIVEAINEGLRTELFDRLSQAQQTVNRDNEAVTLEAQGRHDPCVLPRAVSMVEAMTALVIADHALRQRAVT